MLRRFAIVFFLLLLPICASAQTGSRKTPTQLNTEVNTLFPDNTAGQITPFDLRQVTLDVIAGSVSGALVSVQAAPCTATGDGVTDDTAAIQACENNRPAGSHMIWPYGTYKITGQINASKSGSWDFQGATLDVTSLPGPLSSNGQGGLTVPVSDFYINGDSSSTLNFTPGLNIAAIFLSGGKYSTNGTDPIFGAYTTSAANIAVGATSFVAGRSQDAATLSPNDWIAVFHLDSGGTIPGTTASNWIKVEIKQVSSVTGGTTINVSVPFGQSFSNGSASGGCVDEQPPGTSCWPNLWVKLLNPIQNVGVNNVKINASATSIGIDSDVGVISGSYHHNTINISGLSFVGLFNYDFDFSDNNIMHEATRQSEVSASTGGRIGGNTFQSQGTGNTACIYLDDGVFGMHVEDNQCFGRIGGAVITVQDSYSNIFAHNLVVCGPGSNSGYFFFGSSNNISNGDMSINCTESFILGKNTLTNGSDSASGNHIVNFISRSASASSVRIADSIDTGNSILNLDTDASDGVAACANVICDSGTGTIKLNNVGGAWATGPRMTISGPDAVTIFGVAGATMGIRFGTNGSGSTIQGVDSTLSGSFQPLTIGGGAVTNMTGPFNLGAVSGAGASAKTVCVDASNNVLLKVGAC